MSPFPHPTLHLCSEKTALWEWMCIFLGYDLIILLFREVHKPYVIICVLKILNKWHASYFCPFATCFSMFVLLWCIPRDMFGLGPSSGTEFLKPSEFARCWEQQVSFVMLMRWLLGPTWTACQRNQPCDQRVGTFSPFLLTSGEGRGLEVESITRVSDLINHA